MDDTDYIQRSQQLVWQEMDKYYHFFEQAKIPYTPSQTNFVLFDSLRDGQQVFVNAMRKGLLVRPMNGYQMPRHIRLSIGTEIENRKAIEILTSVLAEVPEI